MASLGLPITPTREFAVSLGNGSKCHSQGICERLEIVVGKVNLRIDAFVLKLGGLDLILGVEWLETLGVVKSDWRKKVMCFEQGGDTVTLYGHGSKDLNHTAALQRVL